MLKFDQGKKKPDKTKLVKNLAQGNVLVPYLDRAFNDFDGPFEFEYSAKEIDDAWHPSGDCTPTVTELYNKAVGNSQHGEIAGSLRKTFMVGHFWHQLLQHVVVEVLGMASWDQIERSGEHGWGNPYMEYEECTCPYNPKGHGISIGGHSENCDAWRVKVQKWQPYHWVHGSADILLDTKKFKGIVDFKTMSSHQFNQNSVPEWAAEKYKCQMNIYMYLFDQPEALIVAIQKDSPHNFKEIRYQRDDDLIDAILDKWEFVSGLIDDGLDPDPDDDEIFKLP